MAVASDTFDADSVGYSVVPSGKRELDGEHTNEYFGGQGGLQWSQGIVAVDFDRDVQ